MSPSPPRHSAPRDRSRRAFAALVALLASSVAATATATTVAPTKLDCDAQPCAEVLPGAVRFEPAAAGLAWQIGRDAGGELVGWVTLSTDLTEIKAYSGKPLVTLLGMDRDGRVAGARVLHHSEPILLVGIPERALTDFVAAYRGLDVHTRVIFGRSDEPGVRSVDAISGATVTALAQNQTILEATRRLATGVGLLEARRPLRGHWVEAPTPWTFAEMTRAGVFGRLVVRDSEMGALREGAADGVFLDLWFTIANAPQIGLGLLPAGDYHWLRGQLGEGDHIVVMLGAGKTSFKGSGFVRGGLFDRVRLEQDMRSIVFTDADYLALKRAVAPDAPGFTEAAVFIARDHRLDPGRAFELVFVGSRYDGVSAFSRTFHAFGARHQMPRSVYALDEPEPAADDDALAPAGWQLAWRMHPERIALLTALLLLVVSAFVGRRWLTADGHRLGWLHRGSMLASLLLVGFWLHAQPSITQLLTLIGSLVHQWRWSLFLSDPSLFLMWCFIALVTLVWGRGVFCGWVCPYGALHELSFQLGRVLGLANLELPERWHLRLRNLRYLVLAALVGAYLYSPDLGERLAEVEPFKSTFFVAPWTRHAGLLAWWLVLLVAGLFTFRPFCRYLCPLGAAAALPSWLRLAGPWRRSYCQSCTICTKTCEPRAIDAHGRIDPRECLSCMECEANYHDVSTCPPLVALRKLDAQPTAAAAVQAELDAAAAKRRRAEERAAEWRPWPR
jgi:NosR/NirI family nitrous oxide reductase transcriptional regulator